MGLDIANIFPGSWFGSEQKTKDLVGVESDVDSNMRKVVYQKLESLDVVKLTKKLKIDSEVKELPLTQEEIKIAEEVRKNRLLETKVFLEKIDGKVLKAIIFLIDFDKKKDDKGIWEQNVRKSGELYVYHPLAVLRTLVEEFNFDPKDPGFTSLFIASVLHDTFEDEFEGSGKAFWKENGKVLPEIERRFGDTKVIEMIEGMTKDKIYIMDGKEKKGVVSDKNTFDNVMRVALIYPGILQIRLADRLHNWRTIEGMKLSKKAESVRETLEFFRPIAVHLGMAKVVTEFDECIEKVRQELAEYNRTKKPDEPIIEINEKDMYDVTPWFSQLGVIDHVEVLKK